MTNKKALSDVVTTVLIILFAIVAVAIIGGIVLNQVNKAGTKINSATICSEIDITPKVCGKVANNVDGCTQAAGCAQVKIMKGGATFKDYTITGVTPIFEMKDGTTKTVTELTGANIPGALTTKDATLKDTDFALVSKAGVAVKVTDGAGQTINCDLYKNTKVDCLG